MAVTNQAIADQLLADSAQIAERMAARRRALLCAACCLSTTTTLSGAQRVLSQWKGPETIREDAAAILSALTTACSDSDRSEAKNARMSS